MLRKSFPSGNEIRMSTLPRKVLGSKLMLGPYRKPTQVGECENTKVNG